MVDVQREALLKQIVKLTEENNKLLKKIHRAQVTGRVIKFLYWIVIIGVAVGAFYFIEPYFNQVLNVYDDIQGVTGGITELFNSQEVEKVQEIE